MEGATVVSLNQADFYVMNSVVACLEVSTASKHIVHSMPR